MSLELGLNKKEYNLFMKDALMGFIVFGGRCFNNCVFCCLKAQNSVGNRNWTNFVSLEDIESVMGIVGKTNLQMLERKLIFVGEGTAFLSCEPFRHPKYKEILQIVNNHYPDFYKTSSTIGKEIKPEDYDFYRSINMSYLISINTLDKDKRLEIMKSKDNYEGLISLLKNAPDLVNGINIVYHGDLDIFKRDIELLKSFDPLYDKMKIKISLPEYSKFSSKEAIKLYQDASNTWEEAVKFLIDNHRLPKILTSSLLLDIPIVQEYKNNFDKRIKHTIIDMGRKNIHMDNVGLLIAESMWEYSKDDKFKNLNMILAKNKTYGGSYVVAGLLTLNDIISAMETTNFDYYIAPKEILNHWDNDILGNTKVLFPKNIFFK